MTKYLIMLAILMCTTLAMAEKKGGPIDTPQDLLCCRCCSPLQGSDCRCTYCTNCPADKAGSGATRGVILDRATLDQLESLGVKVLWEFQGSKVRNCKQAVPLKPQEPVKQ